ncbi:Cell division protein FtsZ [hydrothermal vent metagenome]|uniref:Cell division protein FtsZ n=1 Tax=hydrothermal vent metagenome TaxID=652676 RepID=A0A3B1E125_9ZZZZ
MENDLFNPDNIKVQMPSKVLSQNEAKITVIGVGGGGCNMINHMIREGVHKIDLVVANTDLQALKESLAPRTLQLGPELTRGLGAGMKPEVGREAAIESIEEIKNIVEGSDIVFIAAGLGGGTGTGAASVIAQSAKEAGALTVLVVTKPFKWEGKKRIALAQLGLDELKNVSDSHMVISNDKLMNMIDENTGMQDAFRMVDNVLYQAVHGMSEIILKPGAGGVNLDFADVQTVMQHKGMAIMGIGTAKGDNAAKKALDNAIKSPLLDEISLSGAQGVMVHWTISPNVSMFAISNVMEHITDSIEGNPHIMFGETYDNTLNNDEVKITIVATGFKETHCAIKEEKSTSPLDTKSSNISSTDKNYYDIPPSMRGYSIKYRLNQSS